MTDTATTSSRSSSGGGRRKNVSVEDLLVGRLTLLALRNQLDTRVAELRSQLVVAEGQLRQCADLLGRADEKLARQDPAVLAALTQRTERTERAERAEQTEQPAPEAQRARANPQGKRKTAGAKAARKRPRSKT